LGIQDLELIEERQFEFQSPEQIRPEYLIGVWEHADGGHSVMIRLHPLGIFGTNNCFYGTDGANFR